MKKLFFTLVAIFGISSIALSNVFVPPADCPIEKDQVITASVPITALAASMDETLNCTYMDSYSRPVIISITVIVIHTDRGDIIIISGTICYSSLDITYNVEGSLDNGNFNYTITDDGGTPLSISECVNTMGEVMNYIESQLSNY
ncbi:MAG: hypothetical protein IKX13_01760 [Bacteroidales bacterium]|nr:hypothetical protein [Bacteroidales bacterium]MBR5664458.1 hypothetical protein [Bacteroidales bacterium]